MELLTRVSWTLIIITLKDYNMCAASGYIILRCGAKKRRIKSISRPGALTPNLTSENELAKPYHKTV